MKKHHFYLTLLKNELDQRTVKNPSYSIRSFARSLKIDSGALTQILSGKRMLSKKNAEKILPLLHLSEKQVRQFWISLAEAHLSQDRERTDPFFKKIVADPSDVFPKEIPAEYDFQVFQLLSDWYYIAILEATDIPNCDNTPKWFSNLLKIPQADAEKALRTLIQTGFLIKNADGKLVKKTENFTTAKKELTSEAHRARQKQILELSKKSVEIDPIEIRNHSSATMAIDPSRIPEAKKMIDVFLNRLVTFLSTGEVSEVYELSVSLFKLAGNQEN